MIMPHATGHPFARSGHLLRVDIIAGRQPNSRPISLSCSRWWAPMNSCTSRSCTGFDRRSRCRIHCRPAKDELRWIGLTQCSDRLG